MKIILFLLIGLMSCKKVDSIKIEKEIAEKITKHIIKRDSLKFYEYSKDIYIHITSEKLNEKNFKSYVSLNGLKSNSTQFRTEKMNIDGFKTIVYYSLLNNDFSLPENFYVPDSKSWIFLCELMNNEITLSKINIILSKEENEFNETEIDF